MADVKTGVGIKSTLNNIFKLKKSRPSLPLSSSPPSTSTSPSVPGASTSSSAPVPTSPSTSTSPPPSCSCFPTDCHHHSHHHHHPSPEDASCAHSDPDPQVQHRALPPVPMNGTGDEDDDPMMSDPSFDYAESIEKVKDFGWYWGPVSGVTADRLLVNQPDGSFILRDSSNERYIFSLSVKLDGEVRHVRIEQDQGNFSFGCQHKFRCNTIVDFIEDAVQHSRSGRYLFFLHRPSDPMEQDAGHGPRDPMRVQLLHPVSRFQQVQSLQHTCRFVLLKLVRRDLINGLPIPPKMKAYLNDPHYYTEQTE